MSSMPSTGTLQAKRAQRLAAAYSNEPKRPEVSPDRYKLEPKYSDPERTSSSSFKPPVFRDAVKKPKEPEPPVSSLSSAFSFFKNVFTGRSSQPPTNTSAERSIDDKQLSVKIVEIMDSSKKDQTVPETIENMAKESDADAKGKIETREEKDTKPQIPTPNEEGNKEKTTTVTQAKVAHKKPNVPFSFDPKKLRQRADSIRNKADNFEDEYIPPTLMPSLVNECPVDTPWAARVKKIEQFKRRLMVPPPTVLEPDTLPEKKTPLQSESTTQQGYIFRPREIKTTLTGSAPVRSVPVETDNRSWRQKQDSKRDYNKALGWQFSQAQLLHKQASRSPVNSRQRTPSPRGPTIIGNNLSREDESKNSRFRSKSTTDKKYPRSPSQISARRGRFGDRSKSPQKTQSQNSFVDDRDIAVEYPKIKSSSNNFLHSRSKTSPSSARGIPSNSSQSSRTSRSNKMRTPYRRRRSSSRDRQRPYSGSPSHRQPSVKVSQRQKRSVSSERRWLNRRKSPLRSSRPISPSPSSVGSSMSNQKLNSSYKRSPGPLKTRKTVPSNDISKDKSSYMETTATDTGLVTKGYAHAPSDARKTQSQGDFQAQTRFAEGFGVKIDLEDTKAKQSTILNSQTQPMSPSASRHSNFKARSPLANNNQPATKQQSQTRNNRLSKKASGKGRRSRKNNEKRASNDVPRLPTQQMSDTRIQAKNNPIPPSQLNEEPLPQRLSNQRSPSVINSSHMLCKSPSLRSDSHDSGDIISDVPLERLETMTSSPITLKALNYQSPLAKIRSPNIAKGNFEADGNFVLSPTANATGFPQGVNIEGSYVSGNLNIKESTSPRTVKMSTSGTRITSSIVGPSKCGADACVPQQNISNSSSVVVSSAEGFRDHSDMADINQFTGGILEETDCSNSSIYRPPGGNKGDEKHLYKAMLQDSLFSDFESVDHVSGMESYETPFKNIQKAVGESERSARKATAGKKDTPKSLDQSITHSPPVAVVHGHPVSSRKEYNDHVALTKTKSAKGGNTKSPRFLNHRNRKESECTNCAPVRGADSQYVQRSSPQDHYQVPTTKFIERRETSDQISSHNIRHSKIRQNKPKKTLNHVRSPPTDSSPLKFRQIPELQPSKTLKHQAAASTAGAATSSLATALPNGESPLDNTEQKSPPGAVMEKTISFFTNLFKGPEAPQTKPDLPLPKVEVKNKNIIPKPMYSDDDGSTRSSFQESLRMDRSKSPWLIPKEDVVSRSKSVSPKPVAYSLERDTRRFDAKFASSNHKGYSKMRSSKKLGTSPTLMDELP